MKVTAQQRESSVQDFVSLTGLPSAIPKAIWPWRTGTCSERRADRTSDARPSSGPGHESGSPEAGVRLVMGDGHRVTVAAENPAPESPTT